MMILPTLALISCAGTSMLLGWHLADRVLRLTHRARLAGPPPTLMPLAIALCVTGWLIAASLWTLQ